MFNIEDTPVDNIHEHFDTLMCFLESAGSLRALAYDGIAMNQTNSIGKPTNDTWHKHLFTAFYLYRHAIELALKSLVKIIHNKDVLGHDLENIWKEISPEEISKFSDEFLKEIADAFQILREFHVLKDEQIFRYHNNKSISMSKLRNIEYKDFEMLYGCAYSIRQAILETIDKAKTSQYGNNGNTLACEK